jgi:hypothetical protein
MLGQWDAKPSISQAALLFWRLGRDEPHVWPSDGLADRLGVIVLMPLHIGFTYAGGIRRTV